MSFSEHSIKLTQPQKKAIANALQKGSGVKLRVKHGQFNHGDKLLLSQRQINKINKSHQLGKGCELSLTKRQLDKMKTGGFIGALLPAIIGAVAPFLLGKLFPDRPQQQGEGMIMHNGFDYQGQGINLPGGNGINLPRGHGVVKGNNGGPVTNNVYGNHSTYLPNVSNPNGQGVMLPGQRKRQVKALQSPQYGNGFMAPNSAGFQMLQ